jgi:hypothetical protein
MNKRSSMTSSAKSFFYFWQLKAEYGNNDQPGPLRGCISAKPGMSEVGRNKCKF